MQNLKIRVNSPEESERAQRAFFALGYKWIDFGQKLFALLEEYLFAVSDGVLDYTSNAVRFSENMAREVTLLELEQLAAEAQNTGLNSFETMVEEKMSNLQSCIEKAKTNGWQTDGRDADEQVAELRGNGLSEITGVFKDDPEAAWMDAEIEGRGKAKALPGIIGEVMPFYPQQNDQSLLLDFQAWQLENGYLDKSKVENGMVANFLGSKEPQPTVQAKLEPLPQLLKADLVGYLRKFGCVHLAFWGFAKAGLQSTKVQI